MNTKAISYIEALRNRTKETSVKSSLLNDLQVALIIENKKDIHILSIKVGIYREINRLCNTK